MAEPAAFKKKKRKENNLKMETGSAYETERLMARPVANKERGMVKRRTRRLEGDLVPARPTRDSGGGDRV